MLLIYGDEATDAARGKSENEQRMGAYMAYTKAMREAGVLLDGNRLKPTSAGSTVRVAGGKSKVLDGPYADTKEQLGGYYMIEVSDLDQAIAWAAKCPGASGGAVEVRPVWEMNG
jgi:hypothetical protein